MTEIKDKLLKWSPGLMLAMTFYCYSGVFENCQGYTRRVLIESVSRSVLHPIKVKMDFIDYDREAQSTYLSWWVLTICEFCCKLRRKGFRNRFKKFMLLDLHIFCLISVHYTRAWPKLLLCFLFISPAIMLDDITKTTSKAIEAQLRLSIANSRTSSSSSSGDSNSGGSCSNESSSSSSNSTISSVRLPPSDTKATKLAASRYRPTVCLQPTLPASPVAATFSAAGSCHSWLM